MSSFILQVIRNAFILSGGMFIAFWAGTDIVNWTLCKPILIFFLSYIFAELARFYKLSLPYVTTSKKRCEIKPIIFV